MQLGSSGKTWFVRIELNRPWLVVASPRLHRITHVCLWICSSLLTGPVAQAGPRERRPHHWRSELGASGPRTLAPTAGHGDESHQGACTTRVARCLRSLCSQCERATLCGAAFHWGYMSQDVVIVLDGRGVDFVLRTIRMMQASKSADKEHHFKVREDGQYSAQHAARQ